MNALIGVQNGGHGVTAIELLGGGDLAGAGSTLYSCYSVREKAEALVRFGTARQLAPSLDGSKFVAGALRLQRHKPVQFRTRSEFARSAASRTQHVYLMLKNGEWRMLDGVGTKGNPRWPSVKRVLGERVLGERGLRVPGITTKFDDHEDGAVISGIDALVWGSTSSAAPAPATRPDPAPTPDTRPLAPLVIETL